METIEHNNPKTLAKRAYWLAFQACDRVIGMGVLQDRKNITEDDVWARITGGGHDNWEENVPLSSLYADYIFGRMMKCSISVHNDYVAFPGPEPTLNYQGWCPVYPTYQSLVKAATASLQEERL